MGDLVFRMIEKSFHKRPLVAALLQDQWFSESIDAVHPIDADVLEALAQRQETTQFRKGILADLASCMNLAQMKELNELFLKLDSGNNGMVSVDELHMALNGMRPKAQVN